VADTSNKTEQPTGRRLAKARTEGHFPVSREFVAAIQFLAFVALVSARGSDWIYQTRQLIRVLVERAFQPGLGVKDVVFLFTVVLQHAFLPLGLAGGLLLVITLMTQFATTKIGFSLKKLQPNIQRLNPLPKLQQMPRENMTAMIRSAFMLLLFGSVVYLIVRDNIDALVVIPLADARAGIHQLGASVIELLWKTSAVFLGFGCLDFFRRRRQHHTEMKMSRQEVRDELKESEGSPEIKMRIRQLRRDLRRRRMMQAIPTATAVIVNPTHYAVALRYEHDSMAAPVVVAKGRNYLALRIRQLAVHHQVPLIENPPLAQALYGSVKVGQEIPPHLYRAVAEILAYIFRVMHRG
jgi:flagellar biosynthesis protein FlhB